MLGRDFIKINNVQIPTPATFSTSYDNIEEVNQSEAGTERTIVTRLLKIEYSITFQVTEYWKDKLKTYGALNNVTLKVGNADTIYGRFRITSETLVKHSELNVVPLYTVTAKFYQT